MTLLFYFFLSLLVFECSKCSYDEMHLLPYPERYIEKHIGEITLKGTGSQDRILIFRQKWILLVTYSEGFIDPEQHMFYDLDPPYLQYFNIIDKLVKLLFVQLNGK
jgi:hypothetical protein